MATDSKPKSPKANKGAASLIFLHYGDSKFTTFFQETLKLKKAMQGYERKVLLKEESLPDWIDLSQKDEKLADVKDRPTQANLFKHIIQLANDGYFIDLYIFSHGGSNGEINESGGGEINADEIRDALHPKKTGLKKMPLRIVWSSACYGHELADAWHDVGAKATAGARFIQFYPTSFGPFITDWNKGNVSFNRAVDDSDTPALRTLAQIYILADAKATKKAKKWDGCPVPQTVLGDHKCAKAYFTYSPHGWLNGKGEWQSGRSGQDNMNHSSEMIVVGDKEMTKTSKPKW